MLTLEVLHNLLERDAGTFGQAVFAAKCSLIVRYPTNDNYYGPAVLYTLFGDPALRVKLPAMTGLADRGVTVPVEPACRLGANPVGDRLRVELGPGLRLPARIRVRDVCGRTVLSRMADRRSFVLPVTGLRPGVYLLQAGDRSVRFVVNR